MTRHKKRLQGLRNEEILLPGPRALFLRPFFADKGITLPNPFYSAWVTSLSGISINTGFLRPEEFIGRVLEPFINIVQIGGSPATIGNATLSITDEEWEPLVMESVHAVSIIIILPVLRQDRKTGRTLGKSTIWELKYLVDSARIKQTIVIMPNVIWYGRRRTRRGWEQARLKAAQFGLTLPAYDRKGAVLTFERSSGTWQVDHSFGQRICARRKIAFGVVEAVHWLAVRESFDLLDR